MKRIFLFLIVSLACVAQADDLEKLSVYSTIQPLNLASIEWQEEEWPNESFREYLHRCMRYQEDLQEFKKRRVLFKMFHDLSKNDTSTHNVLADVRTTEDLHLFCGQKVYAPYVASLVDRTVTDFGKIFLYGLIGSPIHDISKLEQRQGAVRYMLEHAHVRQELNDILRNQFKESENLLLSFWAQDGFYNASTRHFFNLPYLAKFNEKMNKNETALLLRSSLGHEQRAFFVAMSMLATVLLPAYGVSLIMQEQLPFMLDSAAQGLQGSGGRVLGLLSRVSNNYISGAAAITAGTSCWLACKEEYEWACDNAFVDVCIQKKMIKAAQFFKGVRAIQNMLAQNPTFAQHTQARRYIEHFFKSIAPQSADMQHLLSLLDTQTFSGEANFWSHHGRYLCAYRLLGELKKVIEPLVMAVGEIDTYASIAQLLTEHTSDKAPYCFAQYVRAEKPVIEMHTFWNPFIEASKVITNNICLGGPEKNSIIITGPNAGGKSTIIKAIAINIILAQSLGIACAQDMRITPFYTIGTYLNVVDDITSGNSLFKAQVLRAQEIIDMVTNTPKNEHSFVVIDEMFNGTSAQESRVAAYSVAKHVGTFANNITAIATHFPLLTQLEQQTNDFMNYKVSVRCMTDGRIEYPFKLERGTSDQHVALDILRQEGYAGVIVEQASQMLHELDVCK